MSLLDDLRAQAPALRNVDDDTLKQTLRTQPEFRSYSDEQFEALVTGAPSADTSSRNSETAPGLAGDLIDAGQMGAYNVAQGLGDFAYEYTGVGRGLGNFGREGAAKQLEQMSPRAAEAIQQQIFESTGSGLWDFTLGEGANPLTIALQTASLAGEAVASGGLAGGGSRMGLSLTGKAIGRSARQRAASQGLDETGQQAAAVQAMRDFASSRTADGVKLGTYGAVETAVNTGQIADGAYQEILAMPDEELDQSQAFAETYWQLADENPDASVDELRQQAREQLGQGAKSLVMRDPALLLTTGVLGGYGGKVLDDLVTKGTGAGRGRLGAAVQQAFVQGTAETGQGGMGQYAINTGVADIGADPDRNPMEGVAAAGLSEGLIGGVMGGGAGVVAGRPQADPAAEAARAREEAATQGADPLGQTQAAQQAEQRAQSEQQAAEQSPEAQAQRQQQVSEVGLRIQRGMTDADDLQTLARGSSFEGGTRLRNMRMIVERAETALEAGNIEQAASLMARAEAIGTDLATALRTAGTRERPMEGELADPEAPQGDTPRLEGRRGQLPPGTGDSIAGESPQQFDARQRTQQEQADTLNRRNIGRDDVIYGEGPTRDPATEQQRRRAAFEQQYGTAQNTGLDGEYLGPDALPGRPNRQGDTYDGETYRRPEQLRQDTAPRIPQSGTVYGEGPVAGNANTGMDQPFERARFTDTGARNAMEGQRAQQQESAERVAQLARTRGRGQTTYLPDNTPIRTRFRVVEASELTASNSPDGRVNQRYPQELQPRDRTNANSQVQVRNIATRLNPERLGASNDAGTGAPIIGSDGVVESGNGRTMAIATAYGQSSPQAERYREFVRAEAQRQGIDPSAVDDMQQPVLVRERITNVDRADFARRANESQVAGMTAYEQAQADADSLIADDLQAWQPDESGDPLAATNRSFQRGFVQRLGNNEASRYTTRDGQATPELGQRMQRAVFAAAYQDADMVEMVTENSDQMRNLAAGLQAAAADLAVARETGSRDALDAIGTINDAVRLVRRSRQDGISVRELTRQTDAFTDAVPETTALLAVAINNSMRSRQAMTTAFRYIGSAVRSRAEGEANGALFADDTTNGDIFDAGFQGQNQDQRTQQRSPERNVQPGAQRREQGTEGQGQAEPTQRPQEEPDQEVDDDPLLSTYTEQELAEREQAQQQAAETEANQQREQAQRAQADAEADDFNLTGSNRSADVAAAQGQQDLTEAPAESEQAESQGASDEPPTPKRRNKPLQYTGYSGEERSVRSYQEIGDYRIAKVNDSLYEVINPDGQAVSQRAGRNGAAEEATRLNDLPADDQRYAIGQSDARPVSRDAIEEALASSPELSDVTVIQSATELPAQSILMMALQGVNPRDVRGLFVGDQLYVIADNVDDVQEGVRTAIHEAVGHKGMRAVLGDDLDRVMLNLYRNLPNSKEGREALREVLRDYPFLDPENRKDRITIAEEMVAHLLEKGHRPKAWQRAVAKIRELLRQLFPSVAWTYTDALALGERSRDYLRKRQAENQSSDDQLYAFRAKQRLNFEDAFEDFTDTDRKAASKYGDRTPRRRISEWYREKTDRAMLKIRQGIVDRYAALKEMDEKLYGADFTEGDDIRRSGWVLARMSNAANGALHTLLHNSRIQLDENERIITPKEDGSQGLGAVLGELGEPAEIQRFMGWIAGNRADKLRQQGRENLFDMDEIDAMKTWNRGQTKDGRNRAELYQKVFAEFQQYRDDVLAIAEQSGILGKGMTEREAFYAALNEFNISKPLRERLKRQQKMAESANTPEDKQKADERAAATMQKIRDLLATRKGSQLADFDKYVESLQRSQRELWSEEFYVPFYRLSEEKGAPSGQMATSGLSRQQAYKRLKGGTQNLNDLLQNTLVNFHHLIDASLKNQAATQAIENAKELGMAERVPQSNRNEKTSTFILEDGQKVFYDIDDPLVYSALTSLSHAGMNSTMMRIMRGFKRVFTNSVTITPQFIAANLIRDSIQATATNEVSKNALSNVLTGWKSFRDAKTHAQMMASGGAFNFGHLYGNNPDELRAQMTRSMRNAKVIGSAGSGWGSIATPIDAVRGLWNWWGDINNTAENANRAAIFTQNQEKGGLKAAFESRDLIDFSAHGAWPAVRVLIDIVPFLNARIQGLDKIYRSGMKPGTNVLRELFGVKKASVTDKQAAGRFWAVTGVVTMATLALYLHNYDDERYEALEEWEKDTYFHIFAGSAHMVIPRPFEVGALATLAERFTEQFVNDEATGKLFAQRMGHMMTDTFSFSPVPQMLQPALDIYANKDSFTGRPIESMGMDRLSPEMRKRYSTSKLGTGLSQLLNSTIGAIGDPDSNPAALSPVQVDHLIEGYLGALGTWMLGATDSMVRFMQGEDAPSKRLYEFQPIRRFYSNLNDVDPYTRYGTVFYEGLREAGRAYSDVKELRELGRLAEAAEQAESKRDMLQLRPALNRAQRRLSTLNQRIEIIQRSNLDGEIKRQRIDRLQAMKVQIQRMQAERILDARANN